MASFGGVSFIMLNGTVGGIWMSIPFFIYGILNAVCTIITVYFVFNHDHRHRRLAIRMYIIGSASVFYRILYVMSCLIKCKITFHSPMDYAFNWLFFLIPMLIGELF